MSKKAGVVAVLCFAVFCGFVAPLAGQLNVTPQSKLYHTTTVHIAWQVRYSRPPLKDYLINVIQNSAGSAGLAVGGFFFAPISFKLGRSSTIFWTLLACTLTQVWAAEMTGEHQFNSFIVSRFFSGLFGGVTGVLGPRILVDLFFLHQRGRAFTIFHWCLNFGSVAGPTASAFIAGNRSWTLEFWWTVGLVGFTCLLCLLFMHETSWNREPGAVNNPAPEGFLTNRFATFFPGSKVAPKTTLRETVSDILLPSKCSNLIVVRDVLPRFRSLLLHLQ
jgi:MFS family permease